MAEALTDIFRSEDAAAAPRRIVVLDTAASKTGALSVLKDFFARICRLSKDKTDNNEWFFIIGIRGLIEEPEDDPRIHVIVREDVKRSRFKRLLFDHFTGKAYLKKFKADVIFSLQNTLPKGAEKLAETVIYLHQPLGFQKIKRFSFFKKWERELAVYQYLIAPEIDASLKRADRIIVQTGWMKDAVIEKDGIRPDIVDIIPPELPELDDLCKHNAFASSESSESTKADRELCKQEQQTSSGELCKQTFIFPAGAILYKNHQCIVDALKILSGKGIRDIRVIFTEKCEDLPWVTVPGECKDLIEWRGMTDRRELIDLYRNSVLLFPSYIETYGLPLAEARALNARILAADTPFAREILSGYDKAEFFPPFDPEKLAGLMKTCI